MVENDKIVENFINSSEFEVWFQSLKDLMRYFEENNDIKSSNLLDDILNASIKLGEVKEGKDIQRLGEGKPWAYIMEVMMSKYKDM